MNLSYKQNFPWGPPTNFPQKIMDGIKIHTFREDPHKKWHKGRLIHHATGVRTKYYNCFLKNECTGVQTVKILYEVFHCEVLKVEVLIDDLLIYFRGYDRIDGESEMKQLAKNDGFDSVEDFFKWFNSDFSGVIVHWTDFRY